VRSELKGAPEVDSSKVNHDNEMQRRERILVATRSTADLVCPVGVFPSQEDGRFAREGTTESACRSRHIVMNRT
jgi:hypothetical protein